MNLNDVKTSEMRVMISNINTMTDGLNNELAKENPQTDQVQYWCDNLGSWTKELGDAMQPFSLED